MTYYILNGKEIFKTDDIIEFSRAVEDFESRIVAQEKVGELFVSTVFLGIDHGWNRSNPPILFETMVFDPLNNEIEGLTERYATWDEAYEGHQNTVKKVSAT